MKQLLILSGKGGTGKTTVASSFIKLSQGKVYADCDVDAPNLHLLLSQEEQPKREDFYGMSVAEIDPNNCINCGICYENCRFHAIEEKNGKYSINPYSCEGCGLCEKLCPEKAVTMEPSIAGDLMLYKNKERVFSTAKLRMGSGTSGKLVTDVKDQMLRETPKVEFSIIDGSPGVGCPVIASMAGVDLVLIVAEPSVSGISDMERILRTANQFGTNALVCINKWDTNKEKSEEIVTFCREREIPFVGKIPFDSKIGEAINQGLTATDLEIPASTEIKRVYQEVMKYLIEVN